MFGLLLGCVFKALIAVQILFLKLFKHYTEALLNRIAFIVLISRYIVAFSLSVLLFKTTSVLLSVCELVLLFDLDLLGS